MKSSEIVSRLLEDDATDFDLANEDDATDFENEIGLSYKSDFRNYLAYLNKHAPPRGASLAQIEQFVSDIDWNALITDDEGSGSCFLTDGSSGVECTGYARTIRSVFGPDRAVVYGFSARDNPESMFADRGYDGHDFALVDERYIVDPWLFEVENYDRVGVFDLKDERSAERVRKFYGDPEAWTRDGAPGEG